MKVTDNIICAIIIKMRGIAVLCSYLREKAAGRHPVRQSGDLAVSSREPLRRLLLEARFPRLHRQHASAMALACELLVERIAGSRMGKLAKPLCACIAIRVVLCTPAMERRVSIGRRLCALPQRIRIGSILLNARAPRVKNTSDGFFLLFT
jgi:hypothetical protein